MRDSYIYEIRAGDFLPARLDERRIVETALDHTYRFPNVHRLLLYYHLATIDS